MVPEKHKATSDAQSLFLEAEHHEEAGELKRAFHSLQAAANLGHPGAQLNLGNFYASGKAIRINLKEAARWYRKAYRNGDRSGAHNLAIDLRDQGNTRSAEIWFKKAIAMKDGSAYLALAKMYLGRRNGKRAAVDLLKKALLLGRSDITEDDKDEAMSLLKELA